MARRRGTGSIFKRQGCKMWTIKFSSRGKTIREATGERDYSEAMKKLTQRLGELDKGTFVEPEMRRIQVRELAEDFLRDYRINGRKSLDDAEARWRIHLEPFFGAARIAEVGSRTIEKYIDSRLEQGAQNATINRELAALKRMFRLGYHATPPKVSRLPNFPRLKKTMSELVSWRMSSMFSSRERQRISGFAHLSKSGIPTAGANRNS